MISFLTACAGETNSDETTGESSDEQVESSQVSQSLKVLFIGNSYTSSNNLAEIVNNLAESAGHELNYDTSLFGGYRFASHSSNATTLAKITADDWDAVVLQNQSQVPGWKVADVTALSLPYAQTLSEAIAANNVNTRKVYFVTWGRQNGDSANCAYYPLVCTFDGHTTALAQGYDIYINNTGGEAAPVGQAWQAIVDDASAPFDANDMWSGDGSHPQLLGSYVAAAVIYARLYNESPENIDYNAGIDSSYAEYIQQITAETVGIHDSMSEQGSILCGVFNTDCASELAHNKAATIAIIEVDCTTFEASNEPESSILATLTETVSCSGGVCSTAGSSQWDLSSGFIENGSYSVYATIDMDGNGTVASGDLEACDDGMVDIGSNTSFSLSGFSTL